jgi:glycosyltransferase involved in cell wall biosynthesis
MIRAPFSSVGRGAISSELLHLGDPRFPMLGDVPADLLRKAKAEQHVSPRASCLAERPLMFAYWGRLGPISKWMLDLAAVAHSQDDFRCSFSYSGTNELEQQFRSLGNDGFPVPTFSRDAFAFSAWKSFVDLRRRLGERLRQDNTTAFVSLMPHVWSPLMAPVIRRAGARHIVVVHDADPHPGDRSAIMTRWILREGRMADHVIALSHFVAERLVAVRGFREDRISVLLHPDLDYRIGRDVRDNDGGSLRVLFAGRILAYKGLDLLVEAVELLRGQGLPVELGVYGRGEIDASLRRRLRALGASVVNRWLSHDELAEAFSKHDVVAAPHVEASQSGVVAAAFGAGLPVVATPVGGLVEQVTSGVNGLIAHAATPHALACALRQLAENPAELAHLRQAIAVTREQRSMRRFFDEICRIAVARPTQVD